MEMRTGVIVEIVIKTAAYTCFLSGVWFAIGPMLLPYINRRIRSYKNYTRLRRLQLTTAAVDRYHRKFYLYRHLDLLLGSTWPWYSENTVSYFVLTIAVIFSVSTVIFQRYTAGWPVAVIFGVLTGMIPYITLLFSLYRKRSETSYELVPATSILLGKYRVNSKNLYYSLMDTVRDMEQYKTLQKSFIKLVSAIQSHRTKEDLEKAIDLFVYQIGTSWAQQLGVQILSAQWENKDIERSLSNVVKDMGKAQEIMEQQKSSDQDTVQMGLFVPLMAFPASLLLMSKVINSGRYFYYQFRTGAGFTSFVATFLICCGGFVVSLLLRKPKNEI